MRTGMPAHLCQERSPCAVRAPPVRTRAGRPRTRRTPQVRAPPARTRAGRPRTRRTPQVRAPLQGQVSWQALACHLSFQAAGRPNAPSSLCGGEGLAESHRGRFLGKPRRAIFRFRQQDAQTPSAPVWEKRARGMRGQPCTGMPAHLCQERTPCAVRTRRTPQVRTPLQGQVGWQALACHLSFQAAGRPNAPSSLCGGEGLEESHRGRFLGKPRRAIFRFGQQDAQTPPSPLVGEGGRGDEGAHAHGNARASLPGTLPLRGARASGAHAGGTPAHPVQPSGARFRRGRFLGSPGVPARCARLRRACGRDARAPGVHLRCARPCRGRLVGKPRHAIFCFRQQDAQTPPAPRVGAGGRGDEGANAHGNARASLPGTLPLRGARASGAHGGGTPAHPAQPSGARPCRSRLVGKPRRAIFRFRQQDDQTPPAPCVGEGVGGSSQGEVFGEAPACHLLFRAAGRPDSPCSPCGSRGQGG